jgi:hypothetical protein
VTNKPGDRNREFARRSISDRLNKAPQSSAGGESPESIFSPPEYAQHRTESSHLVAFGHHS